MRFLASILVLAVTSGVETSQSPSTPTVIYFVRHGEVNAGDSSIPLDAAGEARAQVVAATLRDVPFTNVLSSHTKRARQMVEPLADHRGLKVAQYPSLGSLVNGNTITDHSPSRLAIQPLATAIRELPPGSIALVGVNADNLFGILQDLGLKVAKPGQACGDDTSCIPCSDKSCFPDDEYDNLWLLIASGHNPPRLLRQRFGISVPRRPS